MNVAESAASTESQNWTSDGMETMAPHSKTDLRIFCKISITGRIFPFQLTATSYRTVTREDWVTRHLSSLPAWRF